MSAKFRVGDKVGASGCVDPYIVRFVYFTKETWFYNISSCYGNRRIWGVAEKYMRRWDGNREPNWDEEAI